MAGGFCLRKCRLQRRQRLVVFLQIGVELLVKRVGFRVEIVILRDGGAGLIRLDKAPASLGDAREQTRADSG